MAKNLVIVESPAKAGTLARFLGDKYDVKSTYGHIRDLPKKKLGVDIAKNFKPVYIVDPDKQRVVNELKKAAKGAEVWLASDEDREGEAIAWHTCEILGLDPAKTNRLVFHEITKPAILEAIKQPRTIDGKLVDAQQARRILDRLVGYELSPVLWKKIRAGLSAGRVQSVAVRLIVEREREIKGFMPEGSFRVSAVFDTKAGELGAELDSKMANVELAKKFLEHSKDASYTVRDVGLKPASRSPAPPFTTSTLQQEASRRLGHGVRQTMTLAQKLYESGKITYMRTDSVIISRLAIEAARKYISKTYGDDYVEVRQYKTKSQGAQEAHEAIRPTDFGRQSAGGDEQQKKLYNLIWRRALASQMAPAQIDKTEIAITVSERQEEFLAKGEVLKFDGYYKVYGGSREDQTLPPVKVGEKLMLKGLSALEAFSRPPARYSEATLVKKLEELGIGRPSTYAPTISTIQAREYVQKVDLEGKKRQIREVLLKNGQIQERTQEVVVGADRAKLIPTQLAEIVTDFLLKYFTSIIDYDFTAKAEKELDDIAEGKLKWQEMLEAFYKHFHPLIDKAGDASRSETLQVRELGKDPSSGQPVLARYGRYGPVLQLGDSPESKDDKSSTKPRFAPLPKGVSLDDVTLKNALPMFRLPREVGHTPKGELITADIGRYGPYVKVGSLFISLKDHDPFSVTEAEARRLYKEREAAEIKKVVADFGKLRILNGPYGPYVTDGKKNARVPKGLKPEKLSQTQAQKIFDKAVPGKKFRTKPIRQ